jgi:sulfur relay protein TusB/DsrH
MVLLLLNKFDLDFISIVGEFPASEVSIVMIQDAVYIGLEKSKQRPSLKELVDNGAKFYALKKDVERRGIQEHLLGEIELISIDSFVDLLFLKDQKVINF